RLHRLRLSDRQHCCRRARGFRLGQRHWRIFGSGDRRYRHDEGKVPVGGGWLGWLVFPEFLAYVSGGYTQAHFNGFGLTNGTTLPSNTYNGWFASIGV